MSPLISIIVPIYNTEKYLSDCLNSIISQTYQNIEIILIDDGSTDLSGEICDQYAKCDSRIRVFHDRNEGLVASRKKGVFYSRGEYIGFVDSDDSIENIMYEELVNLLQDDVTDMVCCAAIAVSKKGNSDCLNIVKEQEYMGQDLYNLFKNMMFDTQKDAPGIFQSAWSKLFKKSLIEKCIFDIDNRITYGEDAAIVYNCCLNAQKIIVSNCKYYYYRIIENSMCRRKNIDIFEKVSMFFEYMLQVFSDYPEELQLEKQLKLYILSFIRLGIQNSFRIECKNSYKISYNKLRKDRKIVLYGAGSVGKSYYNQLREQGDYEIVCWIDKKYAGKQIYEELISSIDIIKNITYDKVVIAVKNETLASNINKELVEIGIDRKKIAWIPPIENILQWQIQIE